MVASIEHESFSGKRVENKCFHEAKNIALNFYGFLETIELFEGTELKGHSIIIRNW